MDEKTRLLRDSLVRTLAWAEAAGEDLDVAAVAYRHNLTVEQVGPWLDDDEVWAAVAVHAAEMKASGELHRRKARGAVADMLPDVVEMFYDESTSPAVRAGIYRDLAKQAGLGGKEEGDGEGEAPKVQVLIDMRDPAGGDGGKVVGVQSTGQRFALVEQG